MGRLYFNYRQFFGFLAREKGACGAGEIPLFAPLAVVLQLLLICTLIALGFAISFLGRVTVNTPAL